MSLNVNNHIPWRDEWHSILISSYSTSFYDLLANRINEGHPLIWYVVLFLISKISTSILFMKLFIALINIGIGYLILYKSPFSILQRFLLLFGYYFIFEYAVFIRPYGLVCIFFFSILYLQTNFEKHKILIAVLIAVLSHLLIHSFLLASALILYVFIREQQWLKMNKENILYFSIIGISTIVLIVDLLYFQDLSWRHQSQIPQIQNEKNLLWALQIISKLHQGIIALPNYFSPYFWNTHWPEMFIHFKHGYFFAFFSSSFSIVCIIIISFFYRTFKIELFFFLFYCFMLLIFIGFIYQGEQRHFGFFFLALIGFYWLIYKYLNKFQIILFNLLLTVNFISGIIVNVKAFNRTFSNSKNVAEFIHKNYNSDYLISGIPDYTIEPISGQLNLPFYNFQKKELNTFIKWNNRIEVLNKNEFINEVNKLKSTNQFKSILLIVSIPYFNSVIVDKPINWVEKNKFEGALVQDENYILFEIK